MLHHPQQRVRQKASAQVTANAAAGQNEVRVVETPLSETPRVLTISPISIDIYIYEILETVAPPGVHEARRPRDSRPGMQAIPSESAN